MVAPAYARLKAIIAGNIGSTQTWSVGLSCNAGDFAPGVAAMTSLVTDIRTACDAFFTTAGNPTALWSTDTAANEVKVYYYPASSTHATQQAQAPLGPYAGTNGGSLPTQTSVVASLRTGLAGRHFRGRIYWPCTGVLIGVHQLSSAQTNALSAATANFLTALNAIPLAANHWETIVPSSNTSSGTPVTSVIVDSKLDVQRRRADKVGALYTQETAVTP